MGLTSVGVDYPLIDIEYLNFNSINQIKEPENKAFNSLIFIRINKFIALYEMNERKTSEKKQ